MNAPSFVDFTAWYRRSANPLIEQLNPKQSKQLLDELKRLETEEAKIPEETAVCFLGNAGLGKSTLINALAAGDRSVVPSGGIGPLTAQAIEVRCGKKAYFTVAYHPPKQFNRLIFGLQAAFANELKAQALAPVEIDAKEEIDVREELVTEPTRRDELLQQARLMVSGKTDSDAELGYIIAVLKAVLDPKGLQVGRVNTLDLPRAIRLREALEVARKNQRHICTAADDQKRFDDELYAHAAGFLAPLVAQMGVSIAPGNLADDLALVDLPGVGIANDIHRAITREWIRNQARAVVLVVDRAGITEAVAELLRSTEFLNRLGYAAHNPQADPVSLMVAVTKLDDVAKQHYLDDKSRPKRKRHQHFDDLIPAVHNKIRQQFNVELAKLLKRGDDTLNLADQVIHDRLVNELQVFPLSAIEYRYLVTETEDEEQVPFLQTPEQTGVPALARALEEVANTNRVLHAKRLKSRQAGFVHRLTATLQTMTPPIAALDAELKAEVARVRASFRELLSSKREQQANLRGQFDIFWEQTLPVLIREQVGHAQAATRARAATYLRQQQGENVSILRATIVRGGFYEGKRCIDLPRELALDFDSEIAKRWPVPILKQVKTQVSDYAKKCLVLIQEVSLWAEASSYPQIAKRVTIFAEAFEAETTEANQRIRDSTAEICRQISKTLTRKIQPLIQEKCQAFVDKQLDRNPGAKSRILDLIAEMTPEVIETAGEIAIELLFDAIEQGCSDMFTLPVFKQLPLERLDQYADELEAKPTPELQARINLGRQIEQALGQMPIPAKASS